MSVLHVVRGDTATFDIALTQGADEPLPLDGLEITFTARRRSGGPVVIQHTLDDGGLTVVSESGGTLTLVLQPADTVALTDRPTLRWDVQVNNDDEVRTPLQGKLVVLGDVSDAPSS